MKVVSNPANFFREPVVQFLKKVDGKRMLRDVRTFIDWVSSMRKVIMLNKSREIIALV